MRRRLVIIITLIFFVIINTNYFWEGRLGLLAFPVFLLLALIYLTLIVTLITQIFRGIKEKFISTARIQTIVVLTLCLGLIAWKPNGVIDFDKMQGADIFLAQREGAANCVTTFTLKANNRFRERNVCFGVTEEKGIYEVRNDTIYFFDESTTKISDEYFEYGVLRKTEMFDGVALHMYRDKKDSVGYEIWVKKNDLTNFKIIENSINSNFE